MRLFLRSSSRMAVFGLMGLLCVTAGGEQREPGLLPVALAPEARPPSHDLARGMFLIASRGLVDPNFSESVVLLLEYDAKGALGVIVNRPTKIRLADLLPDIEELKGRTDTVFLGGPVSKNNIVLLMRAERHPPGAGRVFADTYASSNLETLKEAAAGRQAGTFRAYAGYAGWGPRQLDSEVSRGDWYVSPADEATVFDAASESVWPQLMEKNAGQWVFDLRGRLHVASGHP